MDNLKRCELSDDQLAGCLNSLPEVGEYLSHQPAQGNASITYDLFSDALVWEDEMPQLERISQLDADFQLRVKICQQVLLHIRTTLITAKDQDPRLTRFWEEAKHLVPHWPGFGPERCSRSLATVFKTLRVELSQVAKKE